MKYFNSFVFFSVLVKCLQCAADASSTLPESENMTTTTPALTLDQIVVQKWKSTEKELKKLAVMAVKNILPHAVRASEELDLSSSCSRSLMKFLAGVKQMKLWAFRMLDSSGKIPNGIFSGSINSLGDYDSCIEMDVPKSFQGQYCTVAVHPPVPERVPFIPIDEMIPQFENISHPDSVMYNLLQNARYFYHLYFRTSICVPSTCSQREVEMIATKVLELSGIAFNVTVPHCETKVDKVVFTTNEIVIIAVLSSLLLLCIIATAVDVVLKLKYQNDAYQEILSLPLKYLMCFSFYTNLMRLLKKEKSPDAIKVFHGMKVFTILWVILNHTYYYMNYQALSALLQARQKGKEIAFQLVANGFLNVETFFFISAVLVAYGVMKSKDGKINIFLYVFRRIWRLAPPFMFVIACVHLIPHLGSGPVWKETVVDGLTEKCQNYWWSNLLFINNFITNSEMCMNWMWYIPVDTHLYFISLIILIPLKRNPKLAFTLNAVFLGAGTAVTAIFHVYYKLNPTAIYVYVHPDDIDYYVDRGYFRTYTHCASYSVGLCVGYLLATKQKIRIPLVVNILGWITSFGLALSVLYGVYEWNQGRIPGLLVSTLYACTNKFIWALALSWVTITCMTGNGGVVRNILSWKAFVPLSRLTYMTYLIHPVIQIMYFGSTRTLIIPEHRTLVFLYLGHVVMAFMCACALSLLFESPFMALEKVMFSSSRRPRSEEEKNKTEEHRISIGNGKIDDSLPNFKEHSGVYTINIKPINNGI